MTAESSEVVAPSSTPLRSALLTFLIADMRGYTRFTVERGDEEAARLAGRFASLCEDCVAQHNGQVIELRGDEALAAFPSARSALRAAVRLQQTFLQATADDPSLPFTVGMGLDAGEAVPVKGGYRGGALNLAARLCSIAGGGEIFCSETVVGLARKTTGITFVDRGEVVLKGLSGPVRVIQIVPEGEQPESLPPLQPALLTHPTNLPDESTPFIGRVTEIDRISGKLRDPAIRMVTLTGPGGAGKTRLALQVGDTLLHDFQHGVFFVNLAPLADSDLIPSAIAEVLSVTETAGKDLLDRLAEHLTDKHLLLVLDNYEHLTDAADVVASLLDRCRDLHILVTSRTPLHLSREHEHAVPPLSVPDPTRLPDLEIQFQFEAIALFVERARAAKASFALTNDNAPAVAEICSRLDGLPLAIELAAARIKLFPPSALLQRLSSRLTLLTGGARDRPSRQRTLKDTIEWSYSLLLEEEQALITRLSVFVGGCTLESAEAVCNRDGQLDLLSGLESLVDKSMLRQEGEEEPRFSMLESIREYTGERLDARSDGEEFRAAHAKHFLDSAMEARRHLNGPELVSWLDRLERDHDNLRAALRWFLDRADAEGGLVLANSLSYFWYFRGHFSEGWALGTEVLALSARPELAALRAELLQRLGVLALRQGDYKAARTCLDEGSSMARQVDDPTLLAETLGALGFVARVQGDYLAARSALEETLTLARELGHDRCFADALHHLGLIELEADQNLVAAWALNEQSLAAYRQLGDPRMVGLVLGNMGRVARAQSDLAQARVLLTQSVIALGDISDQGPLPQMLYTLAGVDADLGQTERAVRLQAAAEKLEDIIGTQVWPANRRERDGWLKLAHDALGDSAFNNAWTEGQAMTVERTVAYALEESAQ